MHRKFYLSLSLISALILLAYTLFSAYREATPEWKNYQTEYRELFIKNATDKAMREKAEALETGLRQIYLERLNRVDRCTNCHMGVENPLMADAKIPYKQHSGDYLKAHPVDRFGCTVCHYGQGRGTNKKEAHARGSDTYWDYPIIPLEYIQSSCVQCHDFEMLKQRGGETVTGARELFNAKGCRGCHKLNGVGGVLGKALDGVGSQPVAYFPMKNLKGEKSIYSWFKQHFKDPQNIVPESRMKVDVTDKEADLLTTYMLTLKAEESPGEYRRIRYTKEIGPDGEALYKMYCIACHTKGSYNVYDTILKQTVPAIMNPAFRRSANNRFLRNVIQNGRAGTLMIPWRSDAAGLTDEEVTRIAGYITRDRPAVDKQSVSGEITAKRISGHIPDDPEDALWDSITAFRVPLMRITQKTDPNVKALYVKTKNRVSDPLEKFINVKVVYNKKDIAFLAEWTDATRNSVLDVNAFRDGAALQFPMQNGPEPNYRMGEKQGKTGRGMVNIWFWKADLQEYIDTGRQPMPSGTVENLTAGGFGTLALKDRGSQHVYGNGKWKDGRWNVVFKRKFTGDKGNAGFTKGKFTPVGFAVWDGAESDVDGRKAVSTWYYLIPETE